VEWEENACARVLADGDGGALNEDVVRDRVDGTRFRACGTGPGGGCDGDMVGL
jgi:hypothetical protein